MSSSIRQMDSIEQRILMMSPKSEPGDIKYMITKSEMRKSIHRQKHSRKSKNYIMNPILNDHAGINISEHTFQSQNLGSIISTSNMDAPQDYLKVNKLMRVTNESSECPEKKQSKYQNYFTFTPEQRFIILLNLATIIVIYMYFCQIPISIAFQNHRQQAETEQIFQFINIPALLIFVLGSIIKARTAYFQYGILITDTRLILLNYFKKLFLIDLLSVGSIIIYQVSEVFHKGPIAYRFIIILFYLKIGELVQMEKYVINQYDMNRRVKAFLKLFLLITKIFMLCNVVACGFFYFSDNLCRKGNSLGYCAECCWTTFVQFNHKKIRQSNWNIQYSYSIYWASTTMISIGYGDITPQNPLEIAYTIFIQFGSCLVYAYSLNQIWQIIQQLNSKKSQIRHRLSIMNTYMRDKKISSELKSKIKAYLLHFYHTKNVRQKELQKDIISDLTPSLKTELFYESYGFIFKGHSFFKNFTLYCLQISSQRIIQSGYFQQETVFCPLEQEGQNTLFYIQQGQVQNYIQLRKKRISVRKIYLDQTVGLRQFITQLNYKSNLVANKYSVVYKLKYEDWKLSLMEEDEDYQNFFLIKEKLIFDKNYTNLDVVCEFCRQKAHSTEECFQSEIYRLTIKFLKRYKTKSERIIFKRQNTKSSHIASRISMIKGNISAFQSSINRKQSSSLKKRKVSIDVATLRKEEISEQLRHKKIVHRNQKIHHDMVNQIKSKIEYQLKGQDFQDLYSEDSEMMLSTGNIIDKVENYDWYFPAFNADEQVKHINPNKRMRMLKMF